MEIAGVVVCTRGIKKMKEHLLFCKECRIICIEDRVAIDQIV